MGERDQAGRDGASGADPEDALADMTPALRKEYLAIEKEMLDLERGNTMAYYRIGIRMLRLLADGAKYGDGVAEKFAKEGRLDVSTLSRSVALAEWFPEREALEQLLRRRGPDGRSRVMHSHLMQLLPLGMDVRAEMIEAILGEGLNVRDLAKRIKSVVSTSGIRASRQVPVPRTLSGGLSQLMTMTSKLRTKFASTLPDCVLQPLADLPREQFSEEVIGRVDQVREELVELSREAAAGAAEIAKVLDQLKRQTAVESPTQVAPAKEVEAPMPAIARRQRRPISA